jgi:hypothetical protein
MHSTEADCSITEVRFNDFARKFLIRILTSNLTQVSPQHSFQTSHCFIITMQVMNPQGTIIISKVNNSYNLFNPIKCQICMVNISNVPSPEKYIKI